jgi:hypothetical protein
VIFIKYVLDSKLRVQGPIGEISSDLLKEIVQVKEDIIVLLYISTSRSGCGAASV